MAEEVYPLGGRRGETVGLELRGGTLGGLKIAASTIVPFAGSPLHFPRISTAMLGVGLAAGPVLDVESLPPLAVDALPELREPADPAAAPVRAAAPVVFNGRIDPAGDEDRFALAVTPGSSCGSRSRPPSSARRSTAVLQVLGAKGAVLATADDTTDPGARPKTGMAGPAARLARPVARLHRPRRDDRDHAGPPRPRGARRRRLPVPDRRRGRSRPTFELEPERAPGEHPQGRDGRRRRDGRPARGTTARSPLTVADPPAGLTVRPGTIAAGQTVGVPVALGAADAAFARRAPEARRPGRRGRRPDRGRGVRKPLVFAQQGDAAHQRRDPGRPARRARPADARHARRAGRADRGRPRLRRVDRRSRSTATKGADGALAITPLPLPPGLAVPAANDRREGGRGRPSRSTPRSRPPRDR